ncbi:hypothetical protein [Mycobacterium sp. 236(2023)]|uniref:hypothetical protein n=1 Tax=Mycobacterium sp. 236(2023) TaxID=3038163 RepID=UPI0024153E67|nr:hypothetical protein [Mycobacterium sp. 236(2023)]MDG4666069.1 hypothetical protein [Mycobacterium sp. 236(2023)]
MTALGILVALTAALCIGYAVGYRRGSRTPTWRQRTSRAALGRQAVGLIAMVAASQLQRAARRKLPVTRRLPSLFGR